MNSSREVSLRIHCHNLPGARFENRTSVRLGIQEDNEVVHDVCADAPDVTFTIVVRVARNPKDSQPNFLGPFTHGTPARRFIYLCWGEHHGDHWDGFRRAKVHLSHLNREILQAALDGDQSIEVTIKMTDDKGGPVCGSVSAAKSAWMLGSE